jgi:hypothetical protein
VQAAVKGVVTAILRLFLLLKAITGQQVNQQQMVTAVEAVAQPTQEAPKMAATELLQLFQEFLYRMAAAVAGQIYQHQQVRAEQAEEEPVHLVVVETLQPLEQPILAVVAVAVGMAEQAVQVS